MLRFVRTQVRWAGIVVQIVGVTLHNNPLLWFGTIIFLGSYLWAHSIMEEMWLNIEDAANAKKEEKDDDQQDR